MQPTSRRFRVLALTVVLVLVPWLEAAGRQQPRAARPSVQAPAKDPCAAPANRIVAENCRPGNPATEWDINSGGDPTIQGFATEMSVNHGQPIAFKVKTDASTYRIDVYRIGYYGGTGARLMTTIKPSAALPQRQPDCLYEFETRLYDCGNWGVSATWPVPSDAVSGVYVARLVRTDIPPSWRADNGQAGPKTKPPAAPHAYGASGSGKLANALKEPRASHVIFVVRDDERKSDVLFQTADETWQAYNRYGGQSTYGGWIEGIALGRPHRARKVSYNRPITNREWEATVNQFFTAEYPMVRFLERNGYDVTYFSGVDATRSAELIKQHKLYISTGHDEYWTGTQRRNVEAARDAGVSLAFFSGNEVYWKTRFEPSIDSSNTPYRTMVCYKETHDRFDDHTEFVNQQGVKTDPKADEWTGTFRDASPANPEGPNPENALTGTIFTVDAWRNDIIKVPAKYGKYRFWRNTSVAALKGDEVALLEGAVLGHEWDEDLDNGFRPAGLIRLSETTVNNVAYLWDWGSVDDTGTATHHLTLYRAKSGALVFGAGTVQWSWGLDNHHDSPNGMLGNYANRNSIRIGEDPRAPDPRVQQATVNLFADMGVQPATLIPGLVPATASQDKAGPVSRIVSPAPGTLLGPGEVTMTGVATDTGGGGVASVEVSTDGGATWHRAMGTDEWTYTWVVPEGSGTATVMSRATDDSVNTEVPRPGVKVHYGKARLTPQAARATRLPGSRSST
jgi:N,N-dimethylformamidase beta subunit-like, C-terminal/Bacterial Ig domain